MIDIEVANLSRNFQPGSFLQDSMIRAPINIAAQTEDTGSWAFLGEDSLAWIVLAFGAAMVVGNVLALVRPPSGQAERAPLGRSVVMISIGALAGIWGLASLLR